MRRWSKDKVGKGFLGNSVGHQGLNGGDHWTSRGHGEAGSSSHGAGETVAGTSHRGVVGKLGEILEDGPGEGMYCESFASN